MLKRKSKRVLSIVLAVAMIVGLFPIAAFADGGELPAPNNGVIVLTGDTTLSSPVSIDKNTIIDLAGKDLKYSGTKGTAFINIASGCSLTIRDSQGDGVVQVDNQNISCIKVSAGASFTLESGTLENLNSASEASEVIKNYGTTNINGGTVHGVTGIFMFDPNTYDKDSELSNQVAVCNVTGGTIDGLECTSYKGAPVTQGEGWSWGIAIYGPGVAEDGSVDNTKTILNISGGIINAGQGIGTNASSGRYAGNTINITGGTINGVGSGNTGMYLPAIGVTNISGGTITGDQAIRICAGDLNITGGTIQGTALSNDSDLIAGGSGGTTGAIVVGKASGGYVGDIDVNISGNAQIENTAKKNHETDVAPAIVVSDKNMALTTEQPIKDASGNNIVGETFKYSESAINVTINAPVRGDVVKISNLTKDTTYDGGNTNFSIDGSTVTGNVINRSGSNMSVDNTTVTGNVSNSSDGSIIINNSNVTGEVTNTDKNGNLAVLDSNIGCKGQNVTMVNSTVDGDPIPDTATGNVEAFIGATPYATLKDAIEAAQADDVVTVVKDAVVDASDKGNTQGILTIKKDITINGNGKTITAKNVNSTPSMINVESDANVTINDLILDGANEVKHGVNIYQATVTLNDVTVKNHTGYASVVNGSSLTVNGLTTSNNGWGGINVEGKAGDADLVVNNANITEQNSIKFEQETPTDGTAGSVSATINGGNFKYITTGENVEPGMLINGGTFGPLTDEAVEFGAVDIEKYLASGLEFNPVTGEVYKEPEYTGKYSYEIFTKVGENGTISVDRYATEGDDVTITVSPDEAYLLDELTVTTGGKEVEVKDNGDGTYTFKMPSADAKIVVTFAEDPDWEPEPEEPAMPFTDVNENDWFYDVVLYAYDNGLMTGVSATEFAPNQTTTRGMIVSMLARLEGVTSAEDAGFADVAENDWYATAVNWAASVGVVNGYEDNTFRPNAPITREQMAAILYNYADYKGYDVSARADLSDYADAASISSWAEDVLAWANAEGLINGMTATTIDPQGATTRAQTAAMFERFLTAHEA